jgi:uroporphyrinogen-III synthase
MSGGLEGAHVVVLRVGDGEDALGAELRSRGAVAVTVRVATIEDRDDATLLAQVGPLDHYHWVALTSANAARRLELWAAVWPENVRIAVVGPGTARTVGALGLSVDVVAAEGTASSLAEAIDGGPVLFLAAQRARRDLIDALGTRGVEVVTVVAYDTVPRRLDDADVDALEASDVVVATSPGGLEAVCAAPLLAKAIATRRLVTIGPTTSRFAEDRGFEVAASARSRDASSVADAVSVAVSDAVDARHRNGPGGRGRRPEGTGAPEK